MRLRDRLIKGTALNLIAVAFNQGSTLIVNILVARILMKQSFGEYAMVQSTLLTMAALSQLATGYTASKYIAEYRSTDPERAGRIMGLCALVSALMASVGTILFIPIAPWLAGTMLKASHLAITLMIGSGFLFFSTINGYQTGALAGLEAYGALAKAGVVSGIVAVVAISLGAWWGGVNGTLIGLSMNAFVRCAIHNRWLQLESRAQGIEPQYRGVRREKAVIFRFALPASIAGYYAMPMIWLGNSFLVSQPGGYGEMALYAAAMNIGRLVIFVPVVMNSVVSSILNHVKGSGNRQQYDHLYRFNVIFVFSTTLVVALILGFFGDTILGMFGRSFSTATDILIIILASSVFEATTGSLYQRIQNHGKIWLSFIFINLPIGPVFLILAFFLVPKLGALGLGIANIIMTMLSLLGTGLIAWYINRHQQLGIR
jgi:O-antigen/teichoic acid export membrane protein